MGSNLIPPTIYSKIMTTPYFKHVHLDINKIAISKSISNELLLELGDSADLQAFFDETVQNLVIRLTSKVACSPKKTVSTRVPASAWDYIKQNYAPAWFKSRYPVEYVVVEFSAMEIFPEYKDLKNHDRHLDIRIARLT